MDQKDKNLKAVHAKLLQMRERTDLSIRPTQYLTQSFTALDGSEQEFKLRYYQVQMVLHLLAMKRFVVGDDTGLGKTIEAIAALCYVWEKEPQTKAIVLTKKSAVEQWGLEFEKFTEGVKVIVCKGTPKKRQKAREEFLASEQPTVMVMNYGSARADFRHIQDWEGYVFIPDEAHVFKNPKTQIHQVCKHMGDRASRTWGLTATVIKNNLMEGYGVFRVVVPGLFGMSASKFMELYTVTKLQPIKGGRKIPVVVGVRKDQVRSFRTKIDPFFLGRPKHAVAKELPTLTTRVVSVGMTPFQWMKYNEALAGLLEKGDGEEKEVTHLTALIYCQEIVNHPALIECENETSEKLDKLAELLHPADGEFGDKKVIVFTRFERMVGEAIAHLEKKGIKSTRVTGKETEQEREMAKQAFQDFNSDVKVIWITTAGGDSINLQAAEALIFFDTPWSAGDYLQILGRMIRIGSIHDRVYALHLVCKDTVDQRVMEVLKKKMKLVEAIIGKRVLGEDDDGTEAAEFKVESDVKAVYDALLNDARAKVK